MEHTDILLIEENWCHETDINRIVDNMDNVQITGVSGMDSNVLLSGRPYGGCAFLFKSNMRYKVTPINCNNRRCCCILVDMGGDVKFLIFNVYMPCDTTNDYHNLDIYMEVLSSIQCVC